jgi:ribonucleoside-diphosphate reductase beta chain
VTSPFIRGWDARCSIICAARYPELREKAKESIIEAARLAVELEEKFINKMFEMGDLENLKAEDLIEFIKKRANEKLIELGYEAIFAVDEAKASQLDWFYHLTGGLTHTDFFALRPTDYSKANEGKTLKMYGRTLKLWI